MNPFEYEQESIVQDEETTLIDEEDYIYDGNYMYDISDYNVSDMPSIIFMIETSTTNRLCILACGTIVMFMSRMI